jgi:hypothetical protein
MTDSTDEVDVGYDGSDIPQEPRDVKISKNIKNIDKFIKSTGKNQKGKKDKEIVPPKKLNCKPQIKEIHYLAKKSMPIGKTWYTIEYGETRTTDPELDINDQRDDMKRDVHIEVQTTIDAVMKQHGGD